MSKLELMTDQDILLECLTKGTVVIGPNSLHLTVCKAVVHSHWRSCRKFDTTGEFMEMIENPDLYGVSDQTIWVVCKDNDHVTYVYPLDSTYGVQLYNQQNIADE